MPTSFLLQEKNVSTWAGRDITPTLLSNAWRIRSALCRTKSAIFQGRPQCPLLADLFYGRWLTAISPCPFVPVEWASPRQPFSAGAGVPLHTQEWQFPIALQGGVLETHHDEHPMKHRSWSDVITKEMVALGNCQNQCHRNPMKGGVT